MEACTVRSAAATIITSIPLSEDELSCIFNLNKKMKENSPLLSHLFAAFPPHTTQLPACIPIFFAQSSMWEQENYYLCMCCLFMKQQKKAEAKRERGLCNGFFFLFSSRTNNILWLALAQNMKWKSTKLWNIYFFLFSDRTCVVTLSLLVLSPCSFSSCDETLLTYGIWARLKYEPTLVESL